LLFVQNSTSTGSLEGFVLRIGTNEPVIGASVEIMQGTRKPLSVATTDGSGRFKFAGVPQGSYAISAIAPEYLRSDYGARAPYQPGVPVNVFGGREVRDLRIHLTATGAISGHVYTPAGDPIRNVSVQLMKYLHLDGRRMLMTQHQVRTGDLGEYRFGSITPGQYAIAAGAEGVQPVYFPATTDPDATAPIDLLPGADYRGVDLTVVEKDALRIRGRVVDGSTGGTPTSVFMIVSPRGRRTAVAGSTAPRQVRLAPDGGFELGGLAPGSYDLIAMLGDDAARLAARLPIEAGYKDIDNVVLTLQPSFNITGRVFIEGRPISDNDPELRKVQVRLVHDPYLPQVPPRPVQVKPDGTFVMQGAIPGDYRIQVPTGFPSYISAARLGAADLLNSTVRIDAATVNPLEIRLDPDVGVLEAIVLDENRGPARGVQVVLVPEPPKRDRLELYRSTMSDLASGRVRFTSIEPGDYKLFAWEYLESGTYQNLDFIRRYEDLGTRVHIGEGAQETAELKLILTKR
jgi:hypothetical protein